MSVLISTNDIVLEFPSKKIFSRVSLGVHKGDRIGIVGANGDGKSTLLKILAKQFMPDSGEVIYNETPLVGILNQADQLRDEESVEQAVLGDLPEYKWASDRRIREILTNLIDDIPWTTSVGELSGGQRRRVDLAHLLIGDWDILMLDEPTNHLDMKTIAWLAQHLQKRWQADAGALLIVTHDRWFLDETALRMWEVHNEQVEPFEGGFAAYIQQRAERERVSQMVEEKRQNMIRKELAWLSRGARARATKPKFHLKAAQELIMGDPPLRNSLELKQTAMARLGKQVFELEKVSKIYGDTTVLKDINWLIGPGDRFGLLGENGSGKSTLLHIIAGIIEQSSGSLKTGKTVKLAMLSQQLAELSDCQDERVREVLGRYKTRVTIGDKPMTSTALLERLGFNREHFQVYIRDLSGGQKRRLQLLLTLMDEPNVLILDEPGNDMDTEMLAVMEDLLDSWPGTLLVVSHDRYLIERVTDNLFALINGHLKQVPGDVDAYFRMLQDQSQTRKPSHKLSPSQKKLSVQTQNENEQSNNDAPLIGGELFKARKEISSLERKIESLEKQKKDLQQKMLEIDPSDHLSLGRIERDRQELLMQINNLEERWMRLSERISD